MTGHVFMLGHDGYAPHSHEVRADHEGVERLMPAEGDGGMAGLSLRISLIRPLAKSLTATGVGAPAQVRILREVLGLQIGQGGRGGAGSDMTEVCVYCHATGNGGHGGFCPNGSWE